MSEPLDDPRFWRVYHRPESKAARRAFESWPWVDGVQVNFDCGPRYALRVRVPRGPWEIELLLVDKLRSSEHVLGWWDGSHWHPFVLRWEELLALLNYWDEHSGSSPGRDRSFLLLARFVGVGLNEDASFLRRKMLLLDAYQRLGVVSHSEAAYLNQCSMVEPASVDSDWSLDPELGWVFDGSYACYSTRNAAHASAGDRPFPFRQFSELLADIGAG